eukprot:jgi/Botrbrau1/8433/Bobra.0237s0052.1
MGDRWKTEVVTMFCDQIYVPQGAALFGVPHPPTVSVGLPRDCHPRHGLCLGLPCD